MTVAQLIEELQKQPQYMQVYTDVATLDENALKIEGVSIDRVRCMQFRNDPTGRAEEEFAVVVLEVY